MRNWNPLATDDPVLQKTVRVSFVEGMFAQVFLALAGPGSAFLTRFAVLLGAGPVHYGVLAAIGQLSQMFQPMGAVVTRKRTSRKGTVLGLVALGRGLAVLFGLLPFLLTPGAALWGFLALFLVSASVQAVGGNAWVAWVSDSVPLSIRGRFFSIRSRYLFVAGLLAGYLFGAVIDLYEPSPTRVQTAVRGLLGARDFLSSRHLPAVYCLVFLAATLIGFLSLLILRRQPEMPKTVENDSVRRLFVRPLGDRNFRRLLLYGAWWMLAIGVGAPFWQPFMLEKLHMSVVGMQVYGTLWSLSCLLTLRFWGRFIDRFGNRTAMAFAIVLGGINPLVWVFATPDRFWIVYVEAVPAGFMWAGANIIATNFVLAVAPDESRQVYSGLFGAVSGGAAMVTMLLSGLLLPPPMRVLGLRLEPEQVLFGLGGLLRFTTLIPLALIAEPAGRPVGDALLYLRRLTVVHVGHLTYWVTGRRKPRHP